MENVKNNVDSCTYFKGLDEGLKYAIRNLLPVGVLNNHSRKGVVLEIHDRPDPILAGCKKSGCCPQSEKLSSVTKGLHRRFLCAALFGLT